MSKQCTIPRTGRRNGRKVANRTLRKTFLIVCEGQRTEPLYFQGFRVPKEVMRVEGVGYNTLTLVERTIEIRNESREKYDQVWCVFDRGAALLERRRLSSQMAPFSGGISIQ